jgi:restriction system protein
VIGELLAHQGYEVEVGRGTKDGGVDVLAWKKVAPLGLLRTVWQAKHSPKVGLSTIRELADIRDQSQATKGFIVTTGHLTRGALKRITQETYRLGKYDGVDLRKWILATLSGRQENE